MFSYRNTILTLSIYFLIFNFSYGQNVWVDTTLANGKVISFKSNDRGLPSRITGFNISKDASNLTENSIKNITGKLLLENQGLMRINVNNIKLIKAEKNKRGWYIEYIQEINNVPVYGTYIGLFIHNSGNVPLVGINYHPEINLSTKPRISDIEAIDVAKSQVYQTDSIAVKENPKLLIYPINNDFKLVYQIRLTSESIDQTFYVDALNGEIVEKHSNYKYGSIYGNIKIKYWPQYDNDNTQTWQYRNGKIDLYDVSGWKFGSAYANANGDYNIGGLYQPTLLAFKLANNYVKVILLHGFEDDYETSPNLLPTVEYSTTLGAREGTNVFYHVNRIHDFIKGSPFNYNAMDYQMNVEVSSHYDNETKANGYHMWIWQVAGKKQARESDIIYHEYSHNIIYHLYGNRWISPDIYGQDAAMDDGLADYFAATINDDNIIGYHTLLYPRNLQNSRVYDSTKDRYYNGTVIGGACWDLREDPAVGETLANELVFDALEMSPHAYDFEDFALNVLVADDNDGLLYNGTPHYSEIEEAFETNHGIPVTLPPPPSPPPAPTGLVLLNEGEYDEAPELDWNSSAGATSYKVYRRFDGGSWVYVATTSYTDYTDYDATVNWWSDYWLEYYVTAVNAGGESGPSNIVGDWGYLEKRAIPDEGSNIPVAYSLKPNHPNPFNPATAIRYDLPEVSRITLTIYDMMGREVRSWVLHESAGYRQVVWDGKDQNGRSVPTGVYIYRLVAISSESDKRFTAVRKMLLMK